MSSIDGRIDCAMTAQIKGVEEYYKTLDSLETPARLSGRITAELEMALKGKFIPKNQEAIGKELFNKKKGFRKIRYCCRHKWCSFMG